MSKHRSHLYILTGAFVALVAGVLGSTMFSNNPMLIQTRAENITSSVTFENFTNVSSKASSTTSLNQGGLIRAYGTTSASQGDARVATSGKHNLYFEFLSNTEDNTAVTIDDNSRNMAKFQNIKSVKVTYNGGSGDAYIRYSSNAIAWSSVAVTSGTAQELSNAKYVYIGYNQNSTTNRYIKSVTITYSCSPDGGDSGDDDYAAIIASLKSGNGRWQSSITGATYATAVILDFNTGVLSYLYGSEYNCMTFDFTVGSSTSVTLTATSLDDTNNRISFVNGATSVGNSKTLTLNVSGDTVTSITGTLYYRGISYSSKSVTFTHL